MKRSWGREPQRVFVRGLSSGGFVAIDVNHERSLIGRSRYHGRVIAERRGCDRGEGLGPPVIAEAWGDSVDAVVQQLLPTAQYDPAIGAALLRLQTSGATS